MSNTSQPEVSPSVREGVLVCQRDALEVLLGAEREELQVQFQVDTGQLGVTAAFTLIEQQAHAARQVYDAWTNAARAVYSAVAVQTPAPDLEVLDLTDFDLPAPTRPNAAALANIELDLDDPEELEWTVSPDVWAPAERQSLRERAHSFAQTLALRYDWADGTEALTDALDRPHWGRMHVSIEALIRQGMTPAEFELAHALRAEFQERPELNVTPCRTLHRSVYASPALRWATALELARIFPGHDPELLLTRMVQVCHRQAPEHRFSCWSDRLSLMLDGFPVQVDGDYWLTVLEER